MTRQDEYIGIPLEYPGIRDGYFIKEDGTIYSTLKFFKKLTHSKAIGGYRQVCLTRTDGRTTLSVKVHRLVAHNFIDNPQNYKCVNHKDEDKTNNHANNLEWCDHMYNNHYSKSKRSSFYQSLIRKGVGGNCRFTDEDIEDMKMFKNAGICQRDIARVYNTSGSYVCNLTNGNIKRRELCNV